ncbi:MAG: hypothetical protein ACRCVI_00390 [Mycoplasmoidaceae bacterium]
MRYRNQYISTFLNKQDFTPSFSIDSNLLNLDESINNIYEKLKINIDNLSDKIDDNFAKNNESISSIDKRLTKLEVNVFESMNNENIIEKSKSLFDKNLEKIMSRPIVEYQQPVSINKNDIFLKNKSTLPYNSKWEEEFNKKGLSLEDDGIYEYEYGDEDMKYEYYTGELPKTKIVKVRGNDNIQTYTKDDISEFIENESKKLALNEVSKLHSQSETTQKAWLANNQRLVELTNIIEAQEKEIKRLSQNVKNKANLNEDEISDLINNTALKMLRDEYELRISALERSKGVTTTTNSSEFQTIMDELRKEKEENAKLKSMLDGHPPSNQKVELVVSAATPVPPVAGFEIPKPTHKPTLDTGRKRKQKYFFEIIEHNSPKITKADLDK